MTWFTYSTPSSVTHNGKHRRMKMTPCEERGYKVGQVFKRKTSGELYVLNDDDGTSMPYFFVLSDGDPRHPVDLSLVYRIYPPEEESKKVEVECEGKITTISRESAKALNLI